MEELNDFRGLVERLIVDTSEEQPVYMLAGKNGSYIRLSPSAYQLLHLCSSGMSFEAIASQLGQQMVKEVSPDDVEAAYQRLVERVARIDGAPKRPRSGFLIHLPIVPEKIVARIASYLSIAFHPAVALCLFAGIVLAILDVRQRISSLDLTPANFWLGYLLLLTSTLMHELGHASACARYGARPSDIGFTLYLIYPTFYSDVSAAWELRRWQRVVVDLGGAFFQLVVGAGYAVGYTLSAWEPFKVALVMVLGNLVFSLNPIFRFDGYWVVADALGVTNLGRQPRRILRHFLNRLRGRPAKPLPWSTPVKIVLLPYTLLSFGFLGFFIWKMVPMMGRHILNYPSTIATLILDLLDPSRGVGMERWQSLLMSTYMVFIALLMIWRLGNPLFAAIKSRISKLAHRMKWLVFSRETSL
jgi:putative peptide zinc metalloprotease protein